MNFSRQTLNSSESSQPLRDRQQRTFVTLNEILAVNEKTPYPPLSPVFNGQYQAGWNANQHQMKSTSLFYIVFQVLRRYFCEKLQDTVTSPFFSCFTSVFISADIIFYNF